MEIRTSEAEWRRDLKGGQGEVKLGSGAFSGSYSFHSRFEDGKGTNPEELIAAAHGACFSMASSAMLAEVGRPPAKIHTAAKVHFGPAPGGFAISRIDLATEGSVPGIDTKTFEKKAEEAKRNCPVSKALHAVEITLTARLI
jgi:lipoyl-dependent peroxiredoxin